MRISCGKRVQDDIARRKDQRRGMCVWWCEGNDMGAVFKACLRDFILT